MPSAPTINGDPSIEERKAHLSRFTHHPAAGTYAAVALIAAGLTGAIVDNNGTVGLALFVAGAAGLLFLLGRPLFRPLARSLRQVATSDTTPSVV
jgi:hypothetical protein